MLEKTAAYLGDRAWGGWQESTLRDNVLASVPPQKVEAFYQQALRIWEQVRGSEHPDLTFSLTRLANIYYEQDRDYESERLYRRALQLLEQAPEVEPFQISTVLNGLGKLLTEPGTYSEAEQLLQRALRIGEQAGGLTHPLVATYLCDLALLYQAQDRFSIAQFDMRAIHLPECQVHMLPHPLLSLTERSL